MGRKKGSKGSILDEWEESVIKSLKAQTIWRRNNQNCRENRRGKGGEFYLHLQNQRKNYYRNTRKNF